MTGATCQWDRWSRGSVFGEMRHDFVACKELGSMLMGGLHAARSAFAEQRVRGRGLAHS